MIRFPRLKNRKCLRRICLTKLTELMVRIHDAPLRQCAILSVRWVVGSILHGGPIELFLVPATAPRLV